MLYRLPTAYVDIECYFKAEVVTEFFKWNVALDKRRNLFGLWRSEVHVYPLEIAFRETFHVAQELVSHENITGIY